ncbi:hypothetical protein EC988_008037, partial [Linderina pennispora]
MRRVEFQQQSGVISWAMRELEQLLTAPDVAEVVTDCLELLMTEAEILERAVSQVFVRKYETASNDLREQRQDIVDDFTEGLLTGREELAGIIGKLMLKEAWRILEANISLQRQKALLDGGGHGGSGKSKKSKGSQAKHALPPAAGAISSGAEAAPKPVQAPVQPPTPVDVQSQADSTSVLDLDEFDDEEDSAAKKRRKNKKKKAKKKKAKQAAAQAAQAAHAAQTSHQDAQSNGDEDEDEDDNEDRTGGDPQNPFASLSMANANGEVDSDAGERMISAADVPAVSVAAPERAIDDPAKEALVGSISAPVPATAQPVAQAAGQQQQQQQQQQQARPRRGTNAAR